MTRLATPTATIQRTYKVCSTWVKQRRTLSAALGTCFVGNIEKITNPVVVEQNQSKRCQLFGCQATSQLRKAFGTAN